MARSEKIVGTARKTLDDLTKRASQVQMRREERSMWRWLPGLLLGITAGITAGLLFAPQKGDQTRTVVQKTWMDATKNMPERTGGFMHMAQGLGQRVTGMVQTEQPPIVRRRTTKKEK
jgi:gas vesicle protein